MVPCWWQDKQRRADELNAQLAEMKQQLHSAARWKTGVAPPQAASRMEEWDLFHDFAYGPKTGLAFLSCFALWYVGGDGVGGV